MKFVGSYYKSLLLFTMVKLYSIGSKAVVTNFLQDVIICVTYYIVGATLELLTEVKYNYCSSSTDDFELQKFFHNSSYTSRLIAKDLAKTFYAFI